MVVFLWYVYLFAAGVKLLWWLLFRITLSKKTPSPTTTSSSEGISIVVCAHSNCKGLQKLVPLLLKQDYPLFELIVVNDRSKDDTEPWLQMQAGFDNRLNVISITQTPENWNGKKYALQQGLKKAQYPIIALTDSDCTPRSNQWLQHVSLGFQDPKVNIFLGYSPYEYQTGILNSLIRTETLFTAFQYLSLAKINMAYMGVGRNLGYRKSFIEKHLDHFPFQNHMGGDDDLLINTLSTQNDTYTSLHVDSFIESEAPKMWSSWWQQKRRHLSAGQKYKFSTQCILASFWFSSLGFWISFLALCLFTSAFATILVIHSLLLVTGIIVISPIYRIFQERRALIVLPIWDFLYIASSSVIGISTYWIKNKRWS